MRTYQAEIDRLLGHLGTSSWLQQEYDRLIRSPSDLRAYEDLMRPQRKIHEQIDSYLDSTSSLHKAFAQYIDRPTPDIIGRYKDAVSTDSIAAAMGRLSATGQLLSSRIAGATGASEFLESAVGRLADLGRPSIELDSIRRLQALLNDSLIAKVSFSEDGRIAVYGREIDTTVAADDLQMVGAFVQQGASALDAVVTALQGLGPYVRAVVLYVLLPYLISIIANINTPMHEDWWKSLRGQTNRQAIKEVKAQAAVTYSTADLQQFRFVKRTVLHVHSTGKIRSPILDEIDRGKTVRLLKREQDWSFVEYVNTRTTETRQGWVLSRYLARFDLCPQRAARLGHHPMHFWGVGRSAGVRDEEKRQAALDHLAALRIEWEGKPIPDRDALYDDARSGNG
ncbi:MAG: SH3 domain-containing protein [Rhodocyclaceae bacterium]|nr:SH3 domain-containing protein [Rhodocyclaceae bacterium]